MAPNGSGNGAAEITAGAAIFARRDQIVRFERVVRIIRDGQVIDADNGLAHLTQNEERVESLELHGGARIAGAGAAAGGLKGLSGQDVTLTYAADGQALERALISGDASVQIAGEAGKPVRQITANIIDITMAPDGSTPTALSARDGVTLTLPAEGASVARTIKAATLEADGEPGRGLTKARFAGNVDFREKSATVDRDARSARLEVGVKPGFSAFDQATFSGGVRFADPKFFGTAASVRYVVESGALDLTGSEPGIPVPHVATDQIAVDATRIEVVLGGPTLHATGNVKSVLEPPKKAEKSSETKIPSMLKQNQPVNVTAASLNYDGATSQATYEGSAQLWQADTSIKGDTDRHRQQDRRPQRLRLGRDDHDARSGGQGQEEGARAEHGLVEGVQVRGRAAPRHVHRRRALERPVTATSSPRNSRRTSRTAGNELERAEAFDTANSLTLREQGRKTTGSHLTYTSADEIYVVTGLPVAIVDQCGRETKGRTLTFHKATDTIQIDGNDRARTQTKGGGASGSNNDKCQ